jgi:ribosomal protein S12 methylthiotransferase accessory factor
MTDAAVAQLAALTPLVSAKTGIIRRMQRRLNGADEPPLPIIYESLLSQFDFKTGDDMERGACGKGLTDGAAQLGAIGEAVEHYCAAHVRLRRIRRARIAELADAIAPPEFVLYSDKQYTRPDFRYPRWDADSELGWLEAVELPVRSPVWVPASLVFLNFAGQQPQDHLTPPTSSGTAAGADLDHALLSGVLEVIERDAFLVTWLNRLPVPALEFSIIGGACGTIRDHYARYGVETRAYLLATDVPVHAVMAIGLDRRGDGPAAVVGLGCAMSPEGALRRALFEVCQMHPTERHKFSTGDAARLDRYADVHTLDEHALYFTRHDHLGELAFLLEGKDAVRIDDLPDYSTGSVAGDLASIVRALHDVGSRTVYIELTTPDLQDFPIRVVRTLVTEFQPIAFGHDQQRLGGRRLYEVPRRLGYGTSLRTEQDLNPCPHPIA